MKAKHLYDVHEPRQSEWHDERLIEKDGQMYWPAGTVEDHPRAYMLVRMGIAEPADEECTLRAAMTTAEKQIAQRAATAVNAGIRPEDYQRFFDGEITGYDVDGNDIPGPNWVEEQEDDDDE